MRIALQIVFWTSVGLIVWTQLGYGFVLWVAASASRRKTRAQATILAASAATPPTSAAPSVSMIVAAHNEAAVIERKVANARQLQYPEDLLEVIVACDGCTDDTAHRARGAGADLVLELPRGGKVKAQDAAVSRSKAEIVVFSDANSLWRPDALWLLLGAFEDDAVGYACGQVRFTQAAAGQGTNQEGLYWRYEMALRTFESRLCSITAGNGAIYATRRADYIVVDPVMGHDLSFPFNMVKRGRRAVYVPQAIATEKMVPTIEGEQARKRRMMAHTWAIVFAGGMLSLRGYSPTYALMILSHRLLRYLSPFLHLLALATNIALVAIGLGGVPGLIYATTLCLQLALLACAALGGALRWRGLLIVRYYVLTSASLAAGLWDWMRHGAAASWEAAEGTR
jgi:cellulose synthase/poly-beta-1,6-N-acetylglucosamine synthase-like glycosyltransferase